MASTVCPATTNINVNSSSEHISPSTLPISAIVIVVGILAVLFNGVLLVAIVRNSCEILISNGAYLVANVAVADFLTGVISIVYSLLQYYRGAGAIAKNSPVVAIFWTSIEASLTTVFVMSLARYLVIVHPFKARTWLSKKSTLYCCAAIWLFSAICGILKVFYADIMELILSTFFEITTLATLFFYYKIFTSLEHRKQTSVIKKTAGSKRFDKYLLRERNLTTVVVILTSIMIVTVLPYMIAGQVFLVYRFVITPPCNENIVLTFLTYYMPVELTNFVLNPIVYAWRLPKYRKAFLRTFKFIY